MKLDEFIEEVEGARDFLNEEGKETKIMFAGFDPEAEEDVEIKLSGLNANHYDDKNFLFVDFYVMNKKRELMLSANEIRKIKKEFKDGKNRKEEWIVNLKSTINMGLISRATAGHCCATSHKMGDLYKHDKAAYDEMVEELESKGFKVEMKIIEGSGWVATSYFAVIWFDKKEGEINE